MSATKSLNLLRSVVPAQRTLSTLSKKSTRSLIANNGSLKNFCPIGSSKLSQRNYLAKYNKWAEKKEEEAEEALKIWSEGKTEEEIEKKVEEMTLQLEEMTEPFQTQEQKHNALFFALMFGLCCFVYGYKKGMISQYKFFSMRFGGGGGAINPLAAGVYIYVHCCFDVYFLDPQRHL